MTINLLKTFVEEYGIKELPAEWLEQATVKTKVPTARVKVLSPYPKHGVRVCFVGESLEHGEARELLEKAITAGMGLRRNEVHICSIVKSSALDDLIPESENSYFFDEQIERINPEVIVTLGTEALNVLVDSSAGVLAENNTPTRGQWSSFQGIELMPTFNPAFVLTNPASKKEFWLDLQEVMKKLGLEKPV